MFRKFLIAALCLAAPAAFAQSLVVPDRTGVTNTAGQTFVVNYTPGANSGGFDFTLTATPAANLTITAVSASIPNGTTDCSNTANRVICISIAGSPAVDLAAGTITVTYTGGATAAPIALAISNANFVDQLGNNEFGTSTNGTLTLQRANQAALVATATPATIVVGATSALGTTGGSGSGAVSFAVTTGPTVCSITGSTLTATAVGSCTVTATKAGDAAFNPATGTVAVTVTRANQAALLATATPSTLIFGGTSALATSGGSGTGAVSFAVTTGPTICSIAGATATATGVGTCTITATKAADANFNVATATTTITVNNTVPTVTAPATGTTLEDLASAPIAITVGDAETGVGALVLTATSSNQALVTNAALATGLGGSGANRSLVVTPVANANGTATLTLTVADANGGSTPRTLALTVTAVNDAPSFTTAGNITTTPGATGAQTRPGFVTGVVLGPANEQGVQAVQGYAVTEVSDPANIVSAAVLATNGTLSFTLSGTPGTAQLSAVLTDNGGTANSGIASSAPQAFTITVPQAADLEISLSNGVPQVLPGASVVYQLIVANAGPAAVSGARVQFQLPTGLSSATWTCTALSLASCPAASGSGAIDQLVNLPNTGAVRYTFSATVSAAVGATITSTASIAAPVGIVELDTSDNVATDNDPVVGDLIISDGFEGGSKISVLLPPDPVVD